MADEPRIVEAVASMSSVRAEHGGRPLAAIIESAMATAVQKALADGVSMNDPDEIRRRMLDARQQVLDQAR